MKWTHWGIPRPPLVPGFELVAMPDALSMLAMRPDVGTDKATMAAWGLLSRGLLRSVISWPETDGGVHMRRWQELDCTTWRSTFWGGRISEDVTEPLWATGEWREANGEVQGPVATVYLVRDDLEGLASEHLAKILAVVERANNPESKVVTEAAGKIKVKGLKVESRSVRKYMVEIKRLTVHPKSGERSSWYEIFNVDGESLGEIDKAEFRRLVKRVRDS
ncbi:MAG: hypothetical protein GY696_35705 [Gammaproteobacteria bacterium]|nr:hypothetical protein [Gammaproteobacteria bacterium]